MGSEGGGGASNGGGGDGASTAKSVCVLLTQEWRTATPRAADKVLLLAAVRVW